jgi:hypothetical protein
MKKVTVAAITVAGVAGYALSAVAPVHASGLPDAKVTSHYCSYGYTRTVTYKTLVNGVYVPLAHPQTTVARSPLRCSTFTYTY